MDVSVPLFTSTQDIPAIKYPNSYTYQFKLFRQFKMKEGHLVFKLGLGTGVTNFKFKEAVSIFTSQDTTRFSIEKDLPDSLKTYRSKLSVNTIELPLELMLKTNHYKNPVKFSFGINPMLRFSSTFKTKRRYDNGLTFKDKLKNNFNLSNVNVELYVRAAIRHVGLFSSYRLQTLFKSGYFPEQKFIRLGFSYLID